MDITLERYHGLGNDYLVYDPNKNELELNEENVKMLCNRQSVSGIRTEALPKRAETVCGFLPNI